MAIKNEIEQVTEAAPKFFNAAPVLLDINQLNQPLDFDETIQLFHDHGMILVGVRGGDETTRQQAEKKGLALFSNTNSQTPDNEAKPVSIRRERAKTVTQPVRSGQQVYAPGDLVVTSPVSPGAELLAEGHIHIYGPLRGRAFAGISGDQQARIFTHDLKAELIAIAGTYQVNEELEVPNHEHGIQVVLNEHKLQLIAM